MLALESRVDPRRALIVFELLFLIKNGYNTGYRIRKAYDAFFGISPSFGTIYPLLHELYKKGYLTRKRSGQQKFYALSEEGQSIFDSNTSFLQTFSRALNRSNPEQLLVKKSQF